MGVNIRIGRGSDRRFGFSDDEGFCPAVICDVCGTAIHKNDGNIIFGKWKRGRPKLLKRPVFTHKGCYATRFLPQENRENWLVEVDMEFFLEGLVHNYRLGANERGEYDSRS